MAIPVKDYPNVFGFHIRTQQDASIGIYRAEMISNGEYIIAGAYGQTEKEAIVNVLNLPDE
jgi:hypothetical protein